MIPKVHQLFNHATQLALIDNVDGYVDKQVSYRMETEQIQKEFGVKHLLRFDLGENCDGFSPKVHQELSQTGLIGNLHEYPEITHDSLREKLAAVYGVKPREIILSSGLDSILDLITRVFFEKGDSYIMAAPDFFLFESYSQRMGAVPTFIQLDESHYFQWTDDTLTQFYLNIIHLKPKLIWVSNPVNPTGQCISDDKLLQLIEVASYCNTFVVVDEAYGEYLGGPERSFSRFIPNYKNLLVLRTFSKAYGLAGIRLGLLMTSTTSIIKAMLIHRHYFPLTNFALTAAQIALGDQEYIQYSAQQIQIRKQQVFEQLSKLKQLKFIPSDSSIFMMKHLWLTADEFDYELKKRGILASRLQQTGLEGLNYLRFTIRTPAENEILLKSCREINQLNT